MGTHSRRKFLFAAGVGLTLPRLIGTTFAAGKHLPESVPALRGSRKSVIMPTHEWRGDIDERLDFPASWDVHLMKMPGHDAPELSSAEILRRIRKPIGSRPLAELAAGKKSAVVTFDDLTRPTPIAPVAELVVRELEAGGIAGENIFFLGSYGAHRTMEGDEVVQKLGPNLVGRHLWFNHNVVDNLEELGETSYKNRIHINKMFLGADLRVTISGVKIHSIAGYGGGAKAVLPGVAGLQTIHYNHRVLLPKVKTAGDAKVFKNEARLDMVEAARMANVDFSVQILYNNRRQACGIFAGDVVEAFSVASREANQQHRTAILEEADVVVANAYPQVCQGNKARSWINRSVKDGGTGILVMQHPEMISAWHYVYPPVGGGDPLAVLTSRRSALNHQLIVYSQYMQKRMEGMFPPETVFAATWDEVVRTLLARHKGDSRVAVYPYGSLQHEDIDLDA